VGRHNLANILGAAGPACTWASTVTPWRAAVTALRAVPGRSRSRGRSTLRPWWWTTPTPGRAGTDPPDRTRIHRRPGDRGLRLRRRPGPGQTPHHGGGGGPLADVVMVTSDNHGARSPRPSWQKSRSGWPGRAPGRRAWYNPGPARGDRRGDAPSPARGSRGDRRQGARDLPGLRDRTIAFERSAGGAGGPGGPRVRSTHPRVGVRAH